MKAVCLSLSLLCLYLFTHTRSLHLKTQKGLIYQTVLASSKMLYSSVSLCCASGDSLCQSFVNIQVKKKTILNALWKARTFQCLHYHMLHLLLCWQLWFLSYLIYYLPQFQEEGNLLPLEFCHLINFFRLHPNASTCFSYSSRQPLATSFTQKRSSSDFWLYTYNFSLGGGKRTECYYPYFLQTILLNFVILLAHSSAFVGIIFNPSHFPLRS